MIAEPDFEHCALCKSYELLYFPMSFVQVNEPMYYHETYIDMFFKLVAFSLYLDWTIGGCRRPEKESLPSCGSRSCFQYFTYETI